MSDTKISAELKPCPFCGSELVVTKDHRGDPLYAHLDSETCVLGALAWNSDCFSVAAWNTRHQEPVGSKAL